MIHRAVAGAIFDPRGQIARSVRDEPLAALLAVYLLAGFSWVLSDFLVHGKTRVPFSLAMDAVVYMSLLALLLCLGTILLHFFAGILGGRTDHNALFWGVAQSAAPLVLLVPLALAALSL